MNKKEEVFNQEIDMAGTTMRALKIPEEIQEDVIKYMTYINETPEAQQDIPSFFKLISYTF